jgi:hypothetical protein
MRSCSALLPVLAWAMAVNSALADDAGSEFFEKQVRPILVARCFECHSGTAKRLEGGLRLDSLAAAMKGGGTGPAVVPGKPKESLLVDAINYGELYQMPPKTRLPAEEVATLTKWVEMGAPWPKDAVAAAGSTSEFDLAKRKASHWCWQPLTDPAVPKLRNPQSAIRNPIDAFVQAKLEAKGLSPAPPADPRTLIRRLYFDLIGLPPSVQEVDEFLAAVSPSPAPPLSHSSNTEGARGRGGEKERKAIESVVDRLLASPQFGERWGRHWLDLVRYAESRGHEFDNNTPNAFEYRDYVIRALNADVPYDQFVIEHVAGDLLEKPRLHPTEGWNESLIGTGFWFLGEWIHSPVDIRKDECDRVDNQIDVFSKTFLGLTVSCARCHDHKFDAISQADYYALAGYLQSSSYRLARFQTWEQDRKSAEELAAIDAKHWPEIIAAVVKGIEPKLDELAGKLVEAAKTPSSDELGVLAPDLAGCETIIDFQTAPASEWRADGPLFGDGPVRAGQVVLGASGSSPLEVAPYGAARQDLAWQAANIASPSEGDQGRLGGWMRAGRAIKTPKWTLKSGQVHYLIEGAGHVYAAVDSHALVNGPLHGELAKDTGGNSDLPMRWITHDLSRYAGHRVHLEFSPKVGEDFRVLLVVEGAQRPPEPKNRANTLLPANVTHEAARDLIRSTLEMLSADKVMADSQPQDRAVLVNWLISQASLSDKPPKELSDALAAYTADRERVTAGIRSESRVCLAMWDGSPTDEHLLVRGNHKTIGPAVPRRLLTAIDVASGGRQPPEASVQNNRLTLARKLTDPTNPFTSRVMVNRVWHHLFGRGIVPSTDNFGVLGQEPTHPELLDHLAQQFIKEGWSLKRLIRSIVLSDTYQQASGRRDPPDDIAEQADPQNLNFHRQNLRRLEGEAIRDAILAISGRLDRTQFGPSVPVHLTPFMQGRGRPGNSGPLDGAGRRSIYISVRRNFLAPMMLAFDTPIPFSTVGRRNVSNVPAQALILMNDPFVAEQSLTWARKVLADKDASPESRIRRMYAQAFSREPTPEETAATISFLESQAREYGLSAAANEDRVWADLAHVLFNVKEFVFVE